MRFWKIPLISIWAFLLAGIVLAVGVATASAAPIPVIELDAAAMVRGEPWVRIDMGDGVLRSLPDVTAANITPRSRKPGALMVALSIRAEKVRLLNADGSAGLLKVVHPQKLQVQLGDALEPTVTLPDGLDDVPDWALPDGPQWDGAFLAWVRVYVPGLAATEGAGIEDSQKRIKTMCLYLSDYATPAGVPASLYRRIWIAEALRLGWHLVGVGEAVPEVPKLTEIDRN